MKKYLLLFVMSFTSLSFALLTQFSGTITGGVTSVSSSTTNTTKGAAFTLIKGDGAPPDTFALYGYAKGLTAAATNAAGTATCIVRLEVSQDGVTYTAAANSDIKLTIPISGTTATPVCDWFTVPGATYIRVGQVENISLGIVTNLNVGISYNYDK